MRSLTHSICSAENIQKWEVMLTYLQTFSEEYPSASTFIDLIQASG